MTEPLIASQVIGYLKPLARAGYEIHLLTFEKQAHSPARQNEIRARLRAVGIAWHGLRYHRRPTLPATLFDVACGVLRGLVLCRRHRISFLHCRSHVAALMGLVVKLITGRRFIFDCRGLMADEYVDVGHWPAEGLLYRVTKAAERLILRRADGVVVLTERLHAEFSDVRSGDERPMVVIPCCVEFGPATTPAVRTATREERGWRDQFVCAYVGKLGGWYPVELIAQFFAALRRQEPSAFLYVATQSDPRILSRALDEQSVPRESWSAEELAPGDVARMLAAADAGLSLILPCPSKRASSPTKVGEYLFAGIPVVSTPGIGDCDALLGGQQVGVITTGSDSADFEAAARALTKLARDPGIGDRCMRVARQHLSMAGVGAVRYENLYRVLGAKTRTCAAPSR